MSCMCGRHILSVKRERIQVRVGFMVRQWFGNAISECASVGVGGTSQISFRRRRLLPNCREGWLLMDLSRAPL